MTVPMIPPPAAASTASFTDARAMIDALDAAMGIRGVVRKRRRLFMWHNVRIHLDEVHDLGHFIEFEAVIGGDDDEPASNARLAQLVHTLAIRDEDRIATSYSDLLRL
jgi:adenylate cyclase, class 2